MLLLAGAAAGFLGAMLGIGGGVFLVPVLVLWLGLPMAGAVAAGLAAVIATSSAVAAVNVQRGYANMKLGMTLELATTVGALLASAAAPYLSVRLLLGLFGALLLVITGLLWRPPTERPADGEPGALGGSYDDPASGGRVVYGVSNMPAAVGVSVLAGGLSGLLGVGGGVIKVPALHLFCGVPMKASAATSNFMIGVTAAASAYLYWRRGEVLAEPTAWIVLGVLAGSLLGTRLSPYVRDSSLRRAFSIVTLALAFQLLRRALG